MKRNSFSPGFRFSMMDGAVLLFGGWTVLDLAAVIPDKKPTEAFTIAFVMPLIAFFLFCNVFRISRPLELAWAAAFVSLAAATIQLGSPGWSATVAISLALIVLVVIAEMFRPSYHGVGWRRINPRLPEWWEKNKGVEKTTSN